MHLADFVISSFWKPSECGVAKRCCNRLRFELCINFINRTICLKYRCTILVATFGQIRKSVITGMLPAMSNHNLIAYPFILNRLRQGWLIYYIYENLECPIFCIAHLNWKSTFKYNIFWIERWTKKLNCWYPSSSFLKVLFPWRMKDFKDCFGCLVLAFSIDSCRLIRVDKS